MKTSYKFWYVSKNDDGFIDEVAVRFFEGILVTNVVQFEDPTTGEVSSREVEEYQRTKRLSKKDLPHIKNEAVVEENGNECILYTDSDFGKTKDLDDVILFLNSELLRDKKRQAEDTQSVTIKSELLAQDIK